VVSLLWLWFHRLTAAVAEGHAAQTQARRSDRVERERELMDARASFTSTRTAPGTASTGGRP